MRKLLLILPFILMLLLLASCSGDDNTPTAPVEDYTNADLSIAFKEYQYGTLYATDTILNEFIVTNHSDVIIRAGNKIKVACSLNGTKYNLELTSPQPSLITIPQDLLPGQSFTYNPGYLLGNEMLLYFGTTSLEIGLMVYGINDAPADDTFPNDPQPENNKARLTYTTEGIEVWE